MSNKNYLQEVWGEARRVLPGWCYAVLRSQELAYAAKIAELSKAAPPPPPVVPPPPPPPEIPPEAPEVPIAKSAKSKQIVYGVVMDPYGPHGTKVDAQGDYISPAVIEADAHQFMLGDRVIGFKHIRKANARLVESSIEQYPTQEDYHKAMGNLPHSVTRRKFGSDFVHSGSWIVGVQLGNEEWAAYERGELNAFSPGGVGRRVPITKQDMPEIKFFDLAYSG
jgi:hypothetical protein